ncbi:MAG: hypothetical protein PUC06_06255 [Oscillospiraceae bacterium]|nr:hypothetical protein [Oscillospiraceae bacterium]
MKHMRFKRILALSLALCLLLCSVVFAADGAPMGEPPGGFGGDAPPPPPPGGGSMTFYTENAATDLESGAYEDVVYPDATGEKEVAVRVGPGVSATLNNATITKSAGDMSGDDGSFYGVNSGVLAYSEDAATPAELTMIGGSVETSANGGNGIFAYGSSTITLNDVNVTTTGAGGSGGIMVAGGGTLYANNCNVWTEGGSSAAIRSDRGSGLMVIDGGTYVANGSLGTGSPAVYCVADITVSNATMQANNAQAICFEGRNPFHMYNCYLEGNYTASDDDENCNVMVYQSMSGDSEEGTTFCTMVGGVLKANNVSENGNAKMFYTTNTYSYISLCDVEMVYSEGMDTFLLCACNTNQRGWGTAGANGSECVMYTVDQEMDGNIIYDTWSYLGLFMTAESDLEGAILCREDNGDRGCDLYMDATSEWTVTGDSIVRDFYNGGAEIEDDQDKIVSIVGADGTEYVKGDSQYTITVTGTYAEEDHTAYEYVPGVGTVGDGEYTFDTNVEDYVNLDYVPTSPDGTVYEDSRWHDDDDAPASGELGGSVDVPEKAEESGELSGAVDIPEKAEESGELSGSVDIPEKAEESGEISGSVDTPEKAESDAETSNMVPIIVVVLVLLVVVIAVVIIVKKKKK